MPYKVLSVVDVAGYGGYSVESGLNTLEGEGWALVAVIPPHEMDADPSLALHND